jgi:DNA-binding MarR family transcriptional regulator
MAKKRHKESATSEGPLRSLPSVSTLAVFSFLKDTRGALDWKLGDLQDCLNVEAKDAKQILEILEMQGYVRRKKNTDEYLTTGSGESVSASKLPRLKRERVEEALSTMSDRIAAMNKDPRARFSIRKAVAFGDFLSGRAQLQAADVGVMLVPRNPPSRNESNEEDELEFLKQLQAKNRYVHVQRYQGWMSERCHRSLL